MSRTHKGSKSPGWDYWGKRPISGMYCPDRTNGKRTGIQRERAILKRELTKEPQQPHYDEQEYEPLCSNCARGECPLYNAETGEQVGVNGDWELYP